MTQPMQAVYTLGELSRMAGVNKRRMATALIAEGVRIRSHGARHARRICLEQLQSAWPELWDSILLKLSVEEHPELG